MLPPCETATHLLTDCGAMAWMGTPVSVPYPSNVLPIILFSGKARARNTCICKTYHPLFFHLVLEHPTLIRRPHAKTRTLFSQLKPQPRQQTSLASSPSPNQTIHRLGLPALSMRDGHMHHCCRYLPKGLKIGMNALPRLPE